MGKDRVTVWIEAPVLGTLRARAAVEQRSISDLVNEIVVERVRDGISPADGFDVLLPALTAEVHSAVHQSVDGLNSRLKHLLSKALVAGLSNRMMVFQLLAAEFGAEAARTIYDEATAEATRRLEPILTRLNSKAGAE